MFESSTVTAKVTCAPAYSVPSDAERVIWVLPFPAPKITSLVLSTLLIFAIELEPEVAVTTPSPLYPCVISIVSPILTDISDADNVGIFFRYAVLYEPSFPVTTVYPVSTSVTTIPSLITAVSLDLTIPS